MDFIIRPVRISDAPGINLLRRMPGVLENTLGIPSERVARNEEYLRRLDSNAHQFVAAFTTPTGEEVIIGLCGLHVPANPRLRHSASIGLMVHADYQDQGVGTALMKAVLDIADNWLMLTRVELTVFVDNARAIHLYEKMGFVKEGRKVKAAIRGGEYADEYLMARLR